jgi:hypothetical protein
MLSDLSFDNNVEAGGWRGYAQKVAKDAFFPSRDAPQRVHRRTLSAPKNRLNFHRAHRARTTLIQRST